MKTQEQIDDMLRREFHGSKSAVRELDAMLPSMTLAERIALDDRASEIYRQERSHKQ